MTLIKKFIILIAIIFIISCLVPSSEAKMKKNKLKLLKNNHLNGDKFKANPIHKVNKGAVKAVKPNKAHGHQELDMYDIIKKLSKNKPKAAAAATTAHHGASGLGNKKKSVVLKKTNKV